MFNNQLILFLSFSDIGRANLLVVIVCSTQHRFFHLTLVVVEGALSVLEDLDEMEVGLS